MNCDGRSLGRHIRSLIKEAQEVFLWNHLALGVTVRADDKDGELISVRFAGKTRQEMRAELLDAMVELMDRHPAENFSFRVDIDYGDFGNTLLGTWSQAMYYSVKPWWAHSNR